jgi:hypothetical protein
VIPISSSYVEAVTVIVRTTLAELDQAAHAVANPNISMPAPARSGRDTAPPDHHEK